MLPSIAEPPSALLSAPAPAIAVVGACGGCGASAFAAALAVSSPGDAGWSTLLDLDGSGGGFDLLVGLDDGVGARWSDLRLSGGVLEPGALRERLPAIAGVGVLAWDGAADPSERDVAQVLRAARLLGPVVVDLPRWLPEAARPALAEVDAAVLVVPGEVRAVAAGVALVRRLSRLGVRPLVLVRPGPVPAADAGRALSVDDVDVLPAHAWLGGDRSGRLDLSAVPRRIADVAQGLWARAEARR